MRSFLAVILIFAAAVRGLATAQAPDYLFVDGGVYPLYSNPLEKLYRTKRRPDFRAYLDGDSSGNWRGYTAYWQIRRGRLYLIGIDTYLGRKKAFLPQLFPGQITDERVSAAWFSGDLRIPDGKELQNVHMGYGSTYERDIVYTVRSGVVVSRSVVDNTNKPLPDEWERGKEELKKLRETERRAKKP